MNTSTHLHYYELESRAWIHVSDSGTAIHPHSCQITSFPRSFLKSLDRMWSSTFYTSTRQVSCSTAPATVDRSGDVTETKPSQEVLPCPRGRFSNAVQPFLPTLLSCKQTPPVFSAAAGLSRATLLWHKHFCQGFHNWSPSLTSKPGLLAKYVFPSNVLPTLSPANTITSCFASASLVMGMEKDWNGACCIHQGGHVSRQRKRTFAKPALWNLVQLFLVKISLSDSSQRCMKKASGSWRKDLINTGILSIQRM